MARYRQQDQYTVGGLNAELESIERSQENLLSRKGDAPNAMEADLDMNSNRILNLMDAIRDQEPLTLSQFRRYITEKTTSEQQQINSLFAFLRDTREEDLVGYHIR